MGFKIGDFLVKSKEKISPESLRGKIIAVDAMNVFYPFVFVAMKSKESGRVDADGSIGVAVEGFLRRNADFLKMGIAPIYALEGGERTFLKEEEDLEKISIFQGVMDGCLRTVELLGFPIIHTTSEGEAQAAYIVNNSDAYACASQDYDCILFGAERTVMNLKASQKDSLFVIKLDAALKEMGINRDQLIDASMLIGTDFSKGVDGVGGKTALKLIKEYGSIESINDANVKVRKKTVYVPEEEISEVRDIFLNPEITKDYPSPKWEKINFMELRKELVNDYNCKGRSIDSALSPLKKLNFSSKQQTVDAWFR